MFEPYAVAVDKGGNLYVADQGNNRVLKFAHAALKATGANADVEFGQKNFVSDTEATTQSGLAAPRGLAVDPRGNLWVMDYLNERVLKYSHAASKTSGANADTVLGQQDFTSLSGAGTSVSGFIYAEGVAIDDAGTMYITDSDNSRVMIFLNVDTKGIFANADVVLGQSGFTTANTGTSITALNYPAAAAVNSSTGTLYVADWGNNRVLTYTATSPLAVQLYSFTSSIQGAGHVVLKWSTATETNDYGFYVERSSSAGGPFADLAGNFVSGHGTTLQPQSYEWTDTTAPAGTLYYRLRQVDLTGAVAYSKTITIRVSAVEGVKDGKTCRRSFRSRRIIRIHLIQVRRLNMRCRRRRMFY